MQFLEQFHPFPRLPLEIRQTIWSLTCSQTRYIGVRAVPVGAIEGTIKAPCLRYKYQSNCPTPKTLSVCRESRTEALRHYTLAFAVVYETPNFTFTAAPQVYVNRAVDRLCVIDYTAFTAVELMVMGHMASISNQNREEIFALGTENIILSLGSSGMPKIPSYSKSPVIDETYCSNEQSESIPAHILNEVILSEFSGTGRMNMNEADTQIDESDIQPSSLEQESMHKSLDKWNDEYDRVGRWLYDRLNEHVLSREIVAENPERFTLSWDTNQSERMQWLHSMKPEVFVLW